MTAPVSIKGRSLYVAPDSLAAQRDRALRTTFPDRAKIMGELAKIPMSIWAGDWLPFLVKRPGYDDYSGTTTYVKSVLSAAGTSLTQWVLYNIPGRDGRAFSAGGEDAADYRKFVDAFAAGINGTTAIVIIEPDALAMLGDLDSARQAERYACLNYAADAVSAAGGLAYIDAGDSAWIAVSVMASRLTLAGVKRARGFATNVAHFEGSSNEHAYAKALRAELATSHSVLDARYVIDRSRNGTGPSPLLPGMDPESAWCNPRGVGFGARPATDVSPTLRPGCDAMLWVKGIASDGEYDGAPYAGQPWDRNAVDMYWNATPPFDLKF